MLTKFVHSPCAGKGNVVIAGVRGSAPGLNTDKASPKTSLCLVPGDGSRVQRQVVYNLEDNGMS